MGRIAYLIVLTSIYLFGQPDSHAQQAPKRSDSVVKVTAKAGKIDADGKQTITVTLKIDKGWHIYANPVGEESIKPAQTVVTVAGKEKLKDVKIEYPAGKKIADALAFWIYEGAIDIKAVVQRAKGDTAPLTVNIRMMACSASSMLGPALVTVEVPQDGE